MQLLRDIRTALGRAFRTTEGLIAAAAGFILVLFAAVAFPSLSLLRFVLGSELTIGIKAGAIGRILWEGRVFFVKSGGVLALALAVFFAVNMALFAHFLRCRARLAKRAAGASAFGFLVGLVGVGCASCGSVLLISLLGTGAATALIAALPLRGLEFGLLGLIAVGFSIAALARRIAAPEVCVIPAKK